MKRQQSFAFPGVSAISMQMYMQMYASVTSNKQTTIFGILGPVTREITKSPYSVKWPNKSMRDLTFWTRFSPRFHVKIKH